MVRVIEYILDSILAIPNPNSNLIPNSNLNPNSTSNPNPIVGERKTVVDSQPFFAAQIVLNSKPNSLNYINPSSNLNPNTDPDIDPYLDPNP
jgi:hypothetical protein